MRQLEEELREAVSKVEPKKANISISDLLEQPQYRLFKYILILDRYVKTLHLKHKDLKAVQNAYEKFDSINKFNNESMLTIES